MDNSLEEKKNKLLNKYRNLFIQRTGFTGNTLDSYVKNLIAMGEKHYGSNFTEDILKEKRDDSIIWLMDEVAKNGGMIAARNIHDKVKSTMQETINAFAAVANQKARQERVSEKDQILELIDKMDKYEFENYLKDLSWSSDKYAKFKGIVSYKMSQNSNNSEIEISKEVLKSMADEIELVFPQTKKESANVEKQDVSASIGDTLNGYVAVEKAINNNERLTGEQKKESRDTLYNDFDKFVEKNPENVDNKAEEISNQDTEPITESTTDPDNIHENSASQTAETSEPPATARAGKRKEAPKGLVSKFKEKWKNTSFKKKLLIGAVAVGAIIGVGVITATAISQMIATQSFDTNTVLNISNTLNNIDASVLNNADVSSANGIDPNAVVDYSGIGEGTEVHTTLNDALNDTNALSSNQWMNVDHMEAVNTSGEVINLDGMTADQVNQTLDSGDYGVRGSSNGTNMGWFDEETVKNVINQGKGL